MSAIAAAIHVVVDKGPPGNQLLLWLPATTAVFSLLATLASLGAVFQARKIWQASLEPVLVPMLDQGSDAISLRVLNVSDTVAADAGWAVLWSNRRNEGRLPDRSLRGGGDTGSFEVIDVRGTDADDGHPAIAIVWCRDRRGDVFVWATDATTKDYKRKTARGKHPVDLLADVLDGVDPRKAAFCGVAGEHVGPL